MYDHTGHSDNSNSIKHHSHIKNSRNIDRSFGRDSDSEKAG